MRHSWRQAHYIQDVYTPPSTPAAGASAWLACLGRLRGRGGFDLSQAAPRSVGLHVVQSGAGWLATAGGAEEALSPGDVFAVMPGEPVRYREDPRRPWRYTWLGLGGPMAVELARAMGFAGSRRILRAAATPALWRLCDEAQASYASASCSPFTPAALVQRLGEALVPAGGPAQGADPATELRLLIDAGHGGACGIGLVARRLAVDRSTLYRRFRSSYGSGPGLYLRRVRLDRARELLRRGGMTVAAVAADCGYGDPRSFARAYRARFGVAPSRDLA